MRVLILNRSFYPDMVPTAQYSAQLASELAATGHQVTALTGVRAYNDPARRFARRETWRGIHIKRIYTPGLGKKAKWQRIADLASFVLGCAWQLILLPKQSVVIALTSPPLIGFLAALFVWIKGGQLVYWVMDLNPDQAIAAGILRTNSFRSKILERMLRFTFRSSSQIVVLDRFMKSRVCGRGVHPARITVIPPWYTGGLTSAGEQRRENFRNRHGLESKFVVMYAGNHSPCHPLDTLVRAAESLSGDKDIVFCFIGGGVEHNKIAQHAERCKNILCLPYPPAESFTDPLFAADLQVVVMGDAYRGIVHPCKVYNILALGTPLLYIGPAGSHITDLIANDTSGEWSYTARHGEVELVAAHVRNAKRQARRNVISEKQLGARFSRQILLMQLLNAIQNLAPAEGVTIKPLQTAGIGNILQ